MSGSSPSKLLGSAFLAGLGLFGLLLFGNVVRVMLAPEPPKAGDRAPAFSVQTLDGEDVALDELRGRVVLLDFWISNCPGCIGAMPKLNRLQERFSSNGLSIVSLNQDAGYEAAVKDLTEQRNVQFPVAVEDGTVAELYGVYAFPTVVLINRDGVIYRVHKRAVSEEQLYKEVEHLITRPLRG